MTLNRCANCADTATIFELKAMQTAGTYHEKVKIPHYRQKGGMVNLIFSTNAINISNGCLQIPMSRAFSKQHNNRKIKIHMPEILDGKKIREVPIIPMDNRIFFKIQYCYIQEIADRNLNRNTLLSIDVGRDNLAACITT